MSNVEKVEPRRRKLKKGFTLIELLIVVVVIATLMGLVFRLAGVGGGQAARNKTIAHMQKLEFALSGYYAAFGSYPPVPLHGSRDIYCKVNKYGIQDVNGNRLDNALKDIWPSVRAACLSQPVACEYPFNTESDKTKFYLEMMRDAHEPDFGSLALEPPNTLGNAGSVDWTQVQVFKFGVLSFLLPRYLFMLQGDENLYKVGGSQSAQWRSQNDIRQLLDFETGAPGYSDWTDVQNKTGQHKNKDNDKNYMRSKEYLNIARQPSQAVCARWMQALDGIIYGGQTFYGINTRMNHKSDKDYFERDGNIPEKDEPKMLLPIYSASGGYGGEGGGYMLDGMAIRDGWGNDLFYYSDPPYQGYQLWSAGPNRKTIPPWIDSATLGPTDKKTAEEWVADDIVGLSAAAN